MEVCTVGGYEEVGKNMTALKINEDVFLFDAGIFLPAVIELQEGAHQQAYTEATLRSVGAIPNDLVLDKMGWTKKVRAIFIGHAHLDHVGGVPYIANRYPQAPIYGTAFTINVLDSILRDEKIRLSNELYIIDENSTMKLRGKSETYTIEFLHTTHSTIQCVFLAVHSREGVFFYALDFKFDKNPLIGQPPNYRRLRELGKKGVDVLVVDSLYSGTDRRTASERIARHMVEDALSNAHSTGKNAALFITTFSSHIERLQSIVEFGKRTKREIVFLGRSLTKYVECAMDAGEAKFAKRIKKMRYKTQINSFLRKVEKERGRYLVVCTGHQGEPGSILDRIVGNETPFTFKNGDHLIFSSSVIPTEVNIEARKQMDKKLRKLGVRLQTDVHVSGHGGREDLRDLVELLKPKHIIPAHGSQEQEEPMIDLAEELGYQEELNAHLAKNGQVLSFPSRENR